MPSQYTKDSHDDPIEARWRNFRKMRAKWRPPRPWRSPQESEMIRRLVFWWWTCRDSSKPSARAWAKQLGVTHMWLLKLVRKFETDPDEVHRLQAYGDPTPEQLRRAKEYTQRMRDRGELRNPRQRVPPLPPAFVESVRERFAQGWSKSRLARELLLDLDRKRVKKILEKVCSDGHRRRTTARCTPSGS